MRILVVNNFFPPRVGGSSHLSALLAREYAAEGHKVLVLTAAYGDAPDSESRDGYEIRRLPSVGMPKTGLSIDFDITFTATPQNYRELRRVAADFGPDVVHQHGQFLDLSWMTGRWAVQRNIPILLSVHTRLENPNRIYSLGFTALDYLLVRPILSSYDPYFVVMDRLMDGYIRSRYGTRESHLVDIPVGIDLTRFDRVGDGNRVRKKYHLEDKKIILSLGHVIPLRDRRLLVEALPGILRQHASAVIVVVGNVHDSSFLQLAKEIGVEDKVLAVGSVPQSEIPDFLAAAQVEAHDLQGFGLGTASLEAMAAGVPVVAALRVDNFRGIELRDGENIVLVSEGRPAELAGAISNILADPQRAAVIAKRQQELVNECFSIQAVAETHLRSFERILLDVAKAPTPDRRRNPR